MYAKLALNLQQSPCLSLQSAGMIGSARFYIHTSIFLPRSGITGLVIILFGFLRTGQAFLQWGYSCVSPLLVYQSSVSSTSQPTCYLCSYGNTSGCQRSHTSLINNEVVYLYMSLFFICMIICWEGYGVHVSTYELHITHVEVEDNLKEVDLLLYHMGPRTELRLLGMATSISTC